MSDAARKKPVDWDELFPGRFLKAGILQGKKPTLTIADIYTEKLPSNEGGEKVKGIISFVGKDMQLALNKTNGLCLREMFGRKLENWIGKRVVLFADKWNGEDCIRIWGSPDIEADLEVAISLPRRRPFTMTMHATGKKDTEE